MPELKEVFDMVSQKVEPDLDAWNQQERRQRRSSRNRRLGAIAVAVAAAAAVAVFALTNGAGERRLRTGRQPTIPVPDEPPFGGQIVALDGSLVQQLPVELSMGLQPQLSPDRRTIAYYKNDEVWRMGADGTGDTALTPRSNDVVGAKNAVSWSPDGEQLAYAWGGEIYVMNADGSNQRRLTDSPSGLGSYAPAWSPTGSTIVFWRGSAVSDNDGPPDSEIYTIPVDGGSPTRLTDDDHASFQPAWSPDGTQIAYRRHDPDDIVVMDADGTDAHRVTPAAFNPWSPAWSPDGTKIAFLRCCAPHQSTSGVPLLEVSVVDLQTGEVRRLGLYVETENNVPQWVSNSTLFVNRHE